METTKDTKHTNEAANEAGESKRLGDVENPGLALEAVEMIVAIVGGCVDKMEFNHCRVNRNSDPIPHIKTRRRACKNILKSARLIIDERF
jgi:hypothetical protein